MESIISKIIEIDTQAENKLATARLRQQQISHSSFEEAGRLEEQMKNEAEKAIANVNRINDELYKEHMNEIERQYALEINALNDFYYAEHEKIENEIFDKIMGEIS